MKKIFGWIILVLIIVGILISLFIILEWKDFLIIVGSSSIVASLIILAIKWITEE